MSLKVSGVGSVRTMLRNVARKVPDTARKQMHRSAARVVERAKIYVPEDTGALKDSIRIQRSYGFRGRLQIDIVVGDAEINYEDGGRVIDLNQYAWIIHERYSQMKPGPRTVQKMIENPQALIGEGFLRRAVEEEEEPLQRNLVEAITQVIREEDK